MSFRELRRRFGEFRRGKVTQRERRVLGVAIYVFYIMATPMALFGGPGWALLGGLLLLLAVAAYWPLRAYSHGINHRAGNKMLLIGRELDSDEKDRLFVGLDRSIWMVGALFAVFILYWMFSARHGLWQPEASGEAAWLILGVIGLVITLPTVIAVLPYYEDFSDEEEEDRDYQIWDERRR